MKLMELFPGTNRGRATRHQRNKRKKNDSFRYQKGLKKSKDNRKYKADTYDDEDERTGIEVQ